MVTNRILLFGGNGQIGQALQNQPVPAGWACYAPARDICDLTRPGDIAKAFSSFEPDIVINAAAMTDVDACEKDRATATEINFHAVAHIAGQCDTADAPLIHLSTDYVFDGSEGSAHVYQTDDAMNPLSVYGQTKMLGEEAVRHGLYWHVIARTSLVFSACSTNALTRMLRQIDTQDEIRVTADQTANPTSAGAVAEALIMIANAILHGKGDGFGTFHICGAPAATRAEFTQAVIDAYAPHSNRRPRIVAVTNSNNPNRAPRPLHSAMSGAKARDVYGIQPRSWREDLIQAVDQYVKEKKS
jgi:dTDP-4-dehydrorhamnose reductase